MKKIILLLSLLLFCLTVNSQCASNATSAADEEIFNVTFGTLNNSSTCATTGGAGSILNMYSNYTGIGAPNVTQCTNVAFSVQIGTCGGNYGNSIAIYIDWNADLDFIDGGENVYLSAGTTSGPHTEAGSIAIPGSCTAGTKRMRVVNVEAGPGSLSSCGTYTWGETEDYNINVIAGAALTYTSSTVTQLVAGSVTQCASNQQIIGVQIVMGAGCTGSLTQFQLGAGSSTNLLADVSKIRIYNTGTVNSYSPINEFFPGGSTPTGSANTINGSQGLVTGTNYFWICYDMNIGSTVTNLVDGSCTQLTISAVNRVPTTTNPAGNGAISICTQPGGLAGATLWLKSNASTNTTTQGVGISSWGSNAITPAVTLTQATGANQPTYQEGSGNLTNNRFNYNPYFLSDGTNDHLEAIGNFNLGNGNAGNGISVFQIVAQTAGVVSFQWKGPSGMTKLKGDGIYVINNEFGGMGTNNQFFSPTQFQAHLASIRGTQSGLSAGRYNAVTLGNNSNNQPDAASNRISVCRNIGGGEFMAGGIGEFITFPSILSAADNLKVESYLAIKYGITLGTPASVSNYTATSGTNIWVGNATYQNNIIGIGRDDNTALIQKQSHNYDDTVRIYKGALATTNIGNASTFASNISYVVAGATTGKMRNTPAANLEIPSPALGSCAITTRLAREWRITKTNFAETFNMDFKLSTTAAVASVNVAHLRLLVDDDGNFANGGTTCFYNGDGTGIVISYSSPTITITGIANAHIANNSTRFITIGSINLATPLPIELISFDAKLNNKQTVDLHWETLTERDNDYFLVEKSIDGANWSNIGKIDGAGNSDISQLYYLEDINPLIGTNYYRLKQVDFNGVYSYSNIASVDLSSQQDLFIFPNPANLKINVLGKNINLDKVQIIDNLGNIISFEKSFISDDEIEIDTRNIANGVYYLFLFDSKNRVQKIIISH